MKSYKTICLLIAAGIVVVGGLLWFRLDGNQERQTPSPPSASLTPSAEPPESALELRFTDVSAAAGLQFTHVTGATGQRWYPETIGSGVAFFDYNGDTKPDILLVNGQHWPLHANAGEAAATLQLYRNNGANGLENVTAQAGVAIPLYGMGVAVGDYDNDGDRDVFISGYLRHLLLQSGPFGGPDVTGLRRRRRSPFCPIKAQPTPGVAPR